MTIANANYREGVAYSPDGAMYVALPSGSTIPSPTFTGQTLNADGTATAPSYSFANQPTKGMYLASSNVAFANGSNAIAATFAGTGSTSRFIAYTIAFDPGSTDNYLSRAGSNSLLFGGSANSTATSRTQGNKAVTGIANAVATDVLTVTIPNAAHHAVLEIEVQGALGAGGAIGAGSAMATNTYKIAIVRTAGVATVATATAATHAVAVAVAGSETVTATAAVTAMSGAVGATQTFTVQMTISRSAGSSTNHTALITYKLTNANATGITVA